MSIRSGTLPVPLCKFGEAELLQKYGKGIEKTELLRDFFKKIKQEFPDVTVNGSFSKDFQQT